MPDFLHFACHFLALHAPVAHCLLAVVEAVAYAFATVVVRFFHDKVFWCYLTLTVTQTVVAALHYGLLALGHP